MPFGAPKDEIRARIDAIAAVVRSLEGDALRAALDKELPEILAAAREASRRTTGMRPYDEQILGAIVLHQGKIAEMRTGEGKTLVATLPTFLNALTGRGVHVVGRGDVAAIEILVLLVEHLAVVCVRHCSFRTFLGITTSGFMLVSDRDNFRLGDISPDRINSVSVASFSRPTNHANSQSFRHFLPLRFFWQPIAAC